MVTESSLSRKFGEKKKPQLSNHSSESPLTQGDSDVDSTSASSSMQDSTSSVTSSATSSNNQYSSNVKQETPEKKQLKSSISKKIASFGSFMTSRRRGQSKLSQSSSKLSADDQTTHSHPSSIEESDESSNYVKKPMPKFSRNGSLRSVKIFRSNSKNRNKNKSTLKQKNSSTRDFSTESHPERATFSSILKDSKFPEHLKHQSQPTEPEEVLPVAKICTYQHCSLHGHHHHHEPPTKRFEYLKKRATNDPKVTNRETKKREPKATKRVSDNHKNNVDFSIEFYAKTRSEPVPAHDHDNAELADLLFGVNSLQEKNNELPDSDNRDFKGLNSQNDQISNGFLVKNRSLRKKKHVSMWGMIHQHMVSGLAAETGDKTGDDTKAETGDKTGEVIVQKVDEELKSEDLDDSANQETEIRKMYAIKLVRDAIEKILLPEVQDDRSTPSEVISEQDSSETSEKPSDRKDESPAPVGEEKPDMKVEKGAPNRWSDLKKVVLLKKFVKELEKVRKFNPKKPLHLPLVPETEPETVSLRRQTAGDRKSSDEWMLDYALQKVVSELAPTQRQKVALLVKAFETVAP